MDVLNALKAIGAEEVYQTLIGKSLIIVFARNHNAFNPSITMGVIQPKKSANVVSLIHFTLAG